MLEELDATPLGTADQVSTKADTWLDLKLNGARTRTEQRAQSVGYAQACAPILQSRGHLLGLAGCILPPYRSAVPCD